MKKIIILIAFLSAISIFASMNGKKFGLGIGAGTGTSGISGKYYLSNSMAVQGVLGSQRGYGFSFGIDIALEVPPALYNTSDIKIPWYFGGGVSVWNYDSYTGLFFSGVLGLSFQIKKIPLEIAIEWRPLFFLGDSHWSGLYLGGGGGAIRWYF